MRILTLLVAAAAVAPGQTGPEILKKVAETYRSLKSYQFESQTVMETVSESNEQRNRTTVIAAAILPGRRRLELKGGTIAGQRIWDGKTVWDFRPQVKQFARQEQANYKPPRMNFLNDPVDTYQTLDTAAGAKLLREERLDAAGGQHACWVVEVPFSGKVGGYILEQSPTTYWVDKSTKAILKQLESSKISRL